MTSSKLSPKRFASLPMALSAVAAMLALSACDDQMSAQQLRQTASSAQTLVAANNPNPVDAQAQRQQDTTIAHTIEAKFKASSTGLDPDKIDIDITKGRVVLRGLAPSQAAHDEATTLAKAVQGVASVENMLKVRA